uniref:PDZ domain-containing protein n=2 Tax=Ditylum brightwellii TaxID=49249 RepID=A0A7S4RGF6_9STRA
MMTTAKTNPSLFVSTSNDKPKLLTISFASDPSASLGAQLLSHDKGLVEDMFNPAYASILRLVDGETIAKKSGVAIGDAIVAVNGEGFRRLAPEYDESQLEHITAAVNGISLHNNNNNNNENSGNDDEDAKKQKNRVVSENKNNDSYNLLLTKIKSIKKAADPKQPLLLSLERYGWDSKVNAWRRFLIARNGDVAAATKMMTAHTTWKHKTFPIDISDKNVQNVIQSKSVCEIDVPKNDLPPTVYVNFAKLQELDSHEGVVKAFIICTETLLARASDPRFPLTCQFIDLSNVRIASGFRVDILKQVYGAFEPNYPETLSKMVMYPVSKMVASTASMMLNFVNENTRKKFIITDNLEKVCQELGWDKKEVDECGGITQFMHRHEK